MYIGCIRSKEDAECLVDMLRYGYLELEMEFRQGTTKFEWDGVTDDTLCYAMSMKKLNNIYTEIMTDLLEKVDSFEKIEEEE